MWLTAIIAEAVCIVFLATELIKSVKLCEELVTLNKQWEEQRETDSKTVNDVARKGSGITKQNMVNTLNGFKS